MKKNRFLQMTIENIEDELLPIELTVSDGLDYATEADIIFLSQSKNLLQRVTLTAAVTVTINHPADARAQSINATARAYYKNPQYFHGKLYKIQRGEKRHDDYYQYQLNMRTLFGLLIDDADSACYTNMTIPPILADNFKDQKLYPIRWQLQKNYSSKEFIVRYQESSFDFLSRIMQENKIYYYFLHDVQNAMMFISDQPVPQQHFSLPIYYAPHYQGDVVHINQLQHSWNFNKIMQLEAHSNIPNLAAGMQIHIDSDQADIKRNYYIYRLQHRASDYSQIGHQVKKNTDELSHHYQNTFNLYPINYVYRPKETTKKPRITGILPATIVGIGDNIYTKDGCVKVQFNYDHQHQLTHNASPWLYVMQPVADHNMGHQFIPRIGQEVHCLFENGVPEKPIVIKSFYNEKNKLPFNSRTQSGIKTQNLVAENPTQGHVLRFDDTLNNEEIYLKSQGDLITHIKGQYKKTVKANSSLQINGNLLQKVKNTLSITAKQSLKIQVGNSIILLNNEGAHLIADEIKIQA